MVELIRLDVSNHPFDPYKIAIVKIGCEFEENKRSLRWTGKNVCKKIVKRGANRTYGP